MSDTEAADTATKPPEEAANPAAAATPPGPEKKKKVTKPITTTIDLSNMLATAIRTSESFAANPVQESLDAFNADVVGPLKMLKEHVDATKKGAHSVNQFADFYRLRDDEE